jgi:hypothetical protein
MGWDYRVHPCKKADIIKDCLNSVALNLIKKSIQGNELWAIWERRDGIKFIVVYLLDNRNGRWGYKEIAESEDPYYYKCPLSFLKLVPVVNQVWRDGVIEYHKNKKVKE